MKSPTNEKNVHCVFTILGFRNFDTKLVVNLIPSFKKSISRPKFPLKSINVRRFFQETVHRLLEKFFFFFSRQRIPAERRWHLQPAPWALQTSWSMDVKDPSLLLPLWTGTGRGLVQRIRSEVADWAAPAFPRHFVNSSVSSVVHTFASCISATSGVRRKNIHSTDSFVVASGFHGNRFCCASREFQ